MHVSGATSETTDIEGPASGTVVSQHTLDNKVLVTQPEVKLLTPGV